MVSCAVFTPVVSKRIPTTSMVSTDSPALLMFKGEYTCDLPKARDSLFLKNSKLVKARESCSPAFAILAVDIPWE